MQEDFTPFTFGNGRLTELTIEQSFGELRSSTNQSQLSVGSFCRLSAKKAIRDVRNKFKPDSPSTKRCEPPLTEKRFLACNERAYQSALDLVSWASGYDVKALKKYYEDSCEVDWFTQETTEELQNEDEEDELLPEEEQARGSFLARGLIRDHMFYSGSHGVICYVYVDGYKQLTHCDIWSVWGLGSLIL